ncbi:hypothetical protein Goe26_00020 [Bacillus phage vB_BsuM-Goe26]|nr:hypothetical protein Goe26_00020 [Bacillus phage vB_BsuM-Goe26]
MKVSVKSNITGKWKQAEYTGRELLYACEDELVEALTRCDCKPEGESAFVDCECYKEWEDYAIYFEDGF